MIRKTLCYLLLVTMTVHCGSRLGVLSYLFEKRHAIAYSIGMIAEIPIALCNAEYDFSDHLNFQDSDSCQRVPYFATAQEFNLFFISAIDFERSPSYLEIENPKSFYLDFHYRSPIHSIFHPPLHA